MVFAVAHHTTHPVPSAKSWLNAGRDLSGRHAFEDSGGKYTICIQNALANSLKHDRRFLPPDHPYRRDPSFGPHEERLPPPLRSLHGDNGGVGSTVAVEIAQDDDFPLSFHQVRHD